MGRSRRLLPTALAALAVLAVGVGCSSPPEEECEDTNSCPGPPASGSSSPPSESPSPNASPGSLPPLAVELHTMLVDPDPNTESEFAGPFDLDQLKADETLAEIDIACLESNGLRIGYLKDATGDRVKATWGFDLGGAQGATNCADQMRRTDGFGGQVTVLTGRYGLQNVTSYAITSDQGVTMRALFTVEDILFRVSIVGTGATIPELEPDFRTLLEEQVALARQ